MITVQKNVAKPMKPATNEKDEKENEISGSLKDFENDNKE